MGAFTLLDENTMLASPVCSSPFPNGEFEFVEDKEGPPSRAYRKLWEALVLAGQLPVARRGLRGRGRFSRRLDLGPGGARGGGPRDRPGGFGPSHRRPPRRPRDAPRRLHAQAREIGAVDWLCSDVICYPPALFEWVDSWLESGLARNFVCTIKMQGAGFDKASDRSLRRDSRLARSAPLAQPPRAHVDQPGAGPRGGRRRPWQCCGASARPLGAL